MDILHGNILDRMPYFSLSSLYNDLNVWYSNSFYEDVQYYDIYSKLNLGEWYYDTDTNIIYSTEPLTEHSQVQKIYKTSMDETEDFIDYCNYVNNHPVEHPIYTRSLVSDKYIIKYTRPTSINYNANHDYNEDIIESIMDIYPTFSLRYISDVIMRFGFHNPLIRTSIVERVDLNYNEDVILDKINDIYAFGPNTINYGKGIMLNI